MSGAPPSVFQPAAREGVLGGRRQCDQRPAAQRRDGLEQLARRAALTHPFELHADGLARSHGDRELERVLGHLRAPVLARRVDHDAGDAVGRDAVDHPGARDRDRAAGLGYARSL
jgi:hypothetical protein